MLCVVHGIDYIISMSILWSLTTILTKKESSLLGGKADSRCGARNTQDEPQQLVRPNSRESHDED